MEKAKGKLLEELLSVIWAYQTMLGKPTWESPFSLVFRMEVVILTEIGLPIEWTILANEDAHLSSIEFSLDLVDKR